MKFEPTAKIYWLTWFGLLCLTALTFGLAHVHLGWAATPVALAIAFTKATCVALIFMKLLSEDFSIRFALIAAGMVFLLMLLLVSVDMTTRAPMSLPNVQSRMLQGAPGVR